MAKKEAKPKKKKGKNVSKVNILEEAKKATIEEFEDIFALLSNPTTFLCVAVQNVNGGKHMCLEPRVGYYGHIRAFFLEFDAQRYILDFCIKNGINSQQIDIFKGPIAKVVETANDLSYDYGINEGIIITLNKYENGTLRELDTLWDHRKN
jgi:hypothetical protein